MSCESFTYTKNAVRVYMYSVPKCKFMTISSADDGFVPFTVSLNGQTNVCGQLLTLMRHLAPRTWNDKDTKHVVNASWVHMLNGNLYAIMSLGDVDGEEILFSQTASWKLFSEYPGGEAEQTIMTTFEKSYIKAILDLGTATEARIGGVVYDLKTAPTKLQRDAMLQVENDHLRIIVPDIMWSTELEVLKVQPPLTIIAQGAFVRNLAKRIHGTKANGVILMKIIGSPLGIIRNFYLTNEDGQIVIGADLVRLHKQSPLSILDTNYRFCYDIR
jgi:hypothetical protein